MDTITYFDQIVSIRVAHSCFHTHVGHNTVLNQALMTSQQQQYRYRKTRTQFNCPLSPINTRHRWYFFFYFFLQYVKFHRCYYSPFRRRYRSNGRIIIATAAADAAAVAIIVAVGTKEYVLFESSNCTFSCSLDAAKSISFAVCVH